MRHLTTDELVDLVEGTTKDADVPHLAACESCRRQLGDLRTTMTDAASVDVPEPSPLFWHHFSARVREAVASEATPHSGWWRRWLSWPGVMAPLSVVAATVIAMVAVSTPRPTVSPMPSPGSAVA